MGIIHSAKLTPAHIIIFTYTTWDASINVYYLWLNVCCSSGLCAMVNSTTVANSSQSLCIIYVGCTVDLSSFFFSSTYVCTGSNLNSYKH